MSNLTGKVTLPKEVLDHDVLNREPATRRSAFVDLWCWANDRQRSLTVGTGRTIRLERGQLAHSQLTLAKLWRWNTEKVRQVLVEFQNEGLITFEANNTTTIITVLDYTIFNPDTTPEKDAEPATSPPTNPLTESATNQATNPPTNPLQKWEVGSKKVEGGSARPPENFPEIALPGLAEFVAACELQGIPRWRAETEFCWRDEQPERRWPKPSWTKAVTSLAVTWRNEGSPMQPGAGKNGAKKTAESSNQKPGRTAAQARFEISKELEAVRDRLDAAHETDSPPEPGDSLREMELQRQLKALEVAA